MEIPETIKTQQLVKDLAKEIRLVEVNSISLSSRCFVTVLIGKLVASLNM